MTSHALQLIAKLFLGAVEGEPALASPPTFLDTAGGEETLFVERSVVAFECCSHYFDGLDNSTTLVFICCNSQQKGEAIC